MDRDDKNSGGTVTYTIVSGNSDNDKFVIDPTTGVIRTNKVFDRDEPEREKEEYVTIRASDNGRPQLDSVCTLKITITDINDGVPLFEKFVSKKSSIRFNHCLLQKQVNVPSKNIIPLKNNKTLQSIPCILIYINNNHVNCLNSC